MSKHKVATATRLS